MLAVASNKILTFDSGDFVYAVKLLNGELDADQLALRENCNAFLSACYGKSEGADRREVEEQVRKYFKSFFRHVFPGEKIRLGPLHMLDRGCTREHCGEKNEFTFSYARNLNCDDDRDNKESTEDEMKKDLANQSGDEIRKYIRGILWNELGEGEFCQISKSHKVDKDEDVYFTVVNYRNGYKARVWDIELGHLAIALQLMEIPNYGKDKYGFGMEPYLRYGSDAKNFEGRLEEICWTLRGIEKEKDQQGRGIPRLKSELGDGLELLKMILTDDSFVEFIDMEKFEKSLKEYEEKINGSEGVFKLKDASRDFGFGKEAFKYYAEFYVELERRRKVFMKQEISK